MSWTTIVTAVLMNSLIFGYWFMTTRTIVVCAVFDAKFRGGVQIA